MSTAEELRQVPDWSMVRVVIEGNDGKVDSAYECRTCDLRLEWNTTAAGFWYCADCGYEMTAGAGEKLAVEAVDAVTLLAVGRVGRWRRILLWIRRLAR